MIIKNRGGEYRILESKFKRTEAYGGLSWPRKKFKSAFKAYFIYPSIRYKKMASESSKVELSVVERIAQIETALKELKRVARHELKARKGRRASKRTGDKAAKGETPQQLKAWHEEVRKVWDEMRKTDEKTPYKRAVAEASSRRKNAGAAPVVAAAPVAVKAVKKEKAAEKPAEKVVEAAAPAKKAAKKASA